MIQQSEECQRGTAMYRSGAKRASEMKRTLHKAKLVFCTSVSDKIYNNNNPETTLSHSKVV